MCLQNVFDLDSFNLSWFSWSQLGFKPRVPCRLDLWLGCFTWQTINGRGCLRPPNTSQSLIHGFCKRRKWKFSSKVRRKDCLSILKSQKSYLRMGPTSKILLSWAWKDNASSASDLQIVYIPGTCLEREPRLSNIPRNDSTMRGERGLPSPRKMFTVSQEWRWMKNSNKVIDHAQKPTAL